MVNSTKKKKKQMGIILLSTMLVCFFVGCGKKQGLVMVTTESEHGFDYSGNDSSNSYHNEGGQTEFTNQNANYATDLSDEEKSLTMQGLYEKNRGDVLFENMDGCGVTIEYYSNGVVSGTEYYYAGFDKDGRYIQVEHSADDVIKVLDSNNECWYVMKYGTVRTLLYPEEGVTENLINYQHNNLIISDPENSSEENIKGLYHIEGQLVVETEKMENNVMVTYKYFLRDDWKIEKIIAYDKKNQVIMQETVEFNATYEVPEAIEDILKDSENYRMITVIYPTDATKNSAFIVTSRCALDMKLFYASAYGDASCVMIWSDIADSDGNYGDNTIYLK